MEDFEKDTYMIEINDIIQRRTNLTKDEILFVRNYFDRLKIDIEEDQDIVIMTLTSETFGNFIVDIIRSYNTFTQ